MAITALAIGGPSSRLWGRTRDSGLGLREDLAALSADLEHADREEAARCFCLTGLFACESFTNSY